MLNIDVFYRFGAPNPRKERCQHGTHRKETSYFCQCLLLCRKDIKESREITCEFLRFIFNCDVSTTRTVHYASIYVHIYIYSYMMSNVCIWFLCLCIISLLWYLLCIYIFPQTTCKSCICPLGFPNWCSTDAGPGTSPHQAVPKHFWPIGGCEYGNFVESSRVKTKATRLTIGCWKCLGLFSVGSANS